MPESRGSTGDMPFPHDNEAAHQHAAEWAKDAGSVLADPVASLAAIGRSMHEEFDPQRFLDQFSARIQRLIPHDRLVIDHLDEDGRTFTVFAEHAPPGLALHLDYYTTAFDPQARYVATDWTIHPVFAGEAFLVADLRGDPRFANPNPFERKLQEAGLRSALVVPLRSGGRVIGAFAATSLTPRAYTETHLAAAEHVATLIGPFIENVVLLQRERRRRRRLRALEGLTHTLGASLNVRDVFNRLADATRPILDFDVMGVALLSSSGRELEMVAEVDDAPTEETPSRIPLEHFSFSARVEAGESVLIHDAQAHLHPDRPGDRLIIDGGGRSCMIVPLRFGERVGGGLYFGKRQPNWYDRLDVEVAAGIAAQVVLAVQHQRLADEERRLHGSGPPEAGTIRAGGRGNPVPRRGRGAPPDDAGQAPPGPPEPGVRARGWYDDPPRRRSPDRRHQPRPRAGRGGRDLPRGPVLPPQRVSHPPAAPARARR